MPVFIKNFDQLNKSNTQIAGGKGASLGEMTQAGIPVPPGFVILSEAFEFFLEQTGLNVEIQAVLDTVNNEEIHTVEHASEKIKALILNSQTPDDVTKEIKKNYNNLNAEFVAVRSSATAEDSASAAWAGQLESYLNTTEENLLENVKKCWASLFTPRAIFYRFEKKLHNQKISVAVVVQKMIQSEVSGIAFSVHPVTEDYNQLIIEASYGLGEAIVSGQVTPDSYVAEKNSGKIIEKMIQEKTRGLFKKQNSANEWIDIPEDKANMQALTDKQIHELAELIIKIENHYSFPVDIEWALAESPEPAEGKKFFIVQSRPITTLSEDSKKNKNITDHDQSIEEYEFHATASEISILHYDMLISKEAYGQVDYVMLYKNNVLRAYLSKNGIEECFNLSKKLLDDNFFYDFIAKSMELNQKLMNYVPAILTNKNIIHEWHLYLKFITYYFEIYRYYEQPFQQALEESILSYISADKLIEILTDKKFHNIKNKILKKHLERLIQMGEIKLKLHENSEKLFTDKSFQKYVSEKNNIPIEYAEAMRVDEFENALKGDLVVSINELGQRLKKCVFIKENNEWKLLTGKNFDYWQKRIQPKTGNLIKGQPAHKGKVTGRVVIHLSWTGITELKHGDILVTGMTNPQMITQIKKAAAIITDEGGITCHAAIISRELKIPCITGTKIATQVLKDGDLVEVDANEGIVKILKKA